MKIIIATCLLGLLAAGCVTTTPPKSEKSSLYIQEYYDLRDAYSQLLEFKENPHFHRLGFEGVSPFNVWYKNLRSQSAETATLDADHACSRTLTMLGLAYLHSKGAESQTTEILKTQFEAGLEKLKLPRDVLTTLIVTGSTQGTLTPVISCCKTEGGLAARVTVVEETKSREPNVLLLDTGNAVLDRGENREAVNTLIFETMNRLRYNAMGLGPKELALPPTQLTELLSTTQFPIIATNTTVRGTHNVRLSPYERFNINGRRHVVFSVQPVPAPGYATESMLDIADPIESLRTRLKSIENTTDSIIVMSHLSRAENRALLEAFPTINILVTEIYEPGSRTVLGTNINGVSINMLQFRTKDDKFIPARKETLSLRMADSFADAETREKIDTLFRK